MPVPHLLKSYDLLKSPSDMVVSHATGISAGEIAALAEHQIPVSVTPDTEAQMGFSWSLCFRPGLKTTLGVDCHSSSTSSILSLARAASHMARQRDAVAETKDGQGEGAPAHMHLTPSGSTQEAFNAATINGARAVLLGDQIGSIKEGKLADLVIFDAPGSLSMSCVAESDPLVAVVRHSDVRDIEGVIVDGKWRKKDGQICPVAIAESGKELRWPGIRDELLRSQRDIQQRQKGLNLAKAKEAIIGMFHIDKNSLIQ